MPADVRVKVPPAIQALVDKGSLDRLPTSFSAFFFQQLQGWDLLFPNEQSYHERLLTLLAESDSATIDSVFGPLLTVERKMGVNDGNWPRRQFTLDQIDFINRNPHYQEWRRTIARVFAQIDPVLEERLARLGHPRLVIMAAPPDLPAGADRMWLRVAQHGKRIPLNVSGDQNYRRMIWSGGSDRSLASGYPHHFYDSWVISAGKADVPAGSSGVALGYEDLKGYRARLMSEVDRIVQSGTLHGPRELEQRLKQLAVSQPEAAFADDPVLAEFVRAVLLNGNGTLLINNTFVEWATVQAIRRARPSVVDISFGVRNKIKPFSGLLIYSDQEKSTRVPTQTDTLGTYVDLEIFYQYLWQEFETYVEYRNNTAYLFVADGLDELLCIAPKDFPLFELKGAVELTRVHQCAKEWLNIRS